MTEEEFNNLKVNQKLYDNDSKSSHIFLGNKPIYGQMPPGQHYTVQTNCGTNGYFSFWDKEHLIGGFRIRK